MPDNDLLEIVGEDYDDLEGLDDEELDDVGQYEIVGYDDVDIIGEDDDYDDEVGRRRRRRRRRRRGRRPLVRKTPYSRVKRQLLPFGDTGVLAAGNSIDLLGNPQVPFKPERLVIQETTSTNGAVVSDIKVGKNSQFISAGTFPASLFQGNSNEGLFQFDTARPGIDIVITILNAHPADDLTCFVGMVGVALNR
jgi:hypothetical protein